MDKSTEARSRMMAGIRQKNTAPELIVRKLLHSVGFRYRLHDRALPGTPDIVLPKYKTAIFVHGCFWHYHQNCSYSKIPASNSEFWKNKLEKNAKRDNEKIQLLISSNWRVIVIWGCRIKDKKAALLTDLSEILKSQSKCSYYEIGASALGIPTEKSKE